MQKVARAAQLVQSFPGDFASHYRAIEYRKTDEASAFIAALSRVLSSPSGVGHLDTSIPVEVLAHVASDGVTVYSSESAADAAIRAFSPVPFDHRARRVAADDDCSRHRT